jgi:hypothetical protein
MNFPILSLLRKFYLEAFRACLLGGKVPKEKRKGEGKTLKEGSTRGEKEEQRDEQKRVSFRCHRRTMGDS